MIAEEKTYGGNIATWFRYLMIDIIEPALKEYCLKNKIDFRGFHIIVFEKTNPKDGRIWLDEKEITEDELKFFLSMEN